MILFCHFLLSFVVFIGGTITLASSGMLILTSWYPSSEISSMFLATNMLHGFLENIWHLFIFCRPKEDNDFFTFYAELDLEHVKSSIGKQEGRPFDAHSILQVHMKHLGQESNIKY